MNDENKVYTFEEWAKSRLLDCSHDEGLIYLLKDAWNAAIESAARKVSDYEYNIRELKAE